MTGVCFDSTEAKVRSALLYGNQFIGNETAVLLLRVPGSDDLYFTESVFKNNGTDIDSRVDNKIVRDP